MPRSKRLDRPIKKTINLPQSIIEETESYLFDPVRGKVRHGALSALVTDLLIKSNLEKEADLQQRLRKGTDNDGDNLNLRGSAAYDPSATVGTHQRPSGESAETGRPIGRGDPHGVASTPSGAGPAAERSQDED